MLNHTSVECTDSRRMRDQPKRKAKSNGSSVHSTPVWFNMILHASFSGLFEKSKLSVSYIVYDCLLLH